MSNIPPTSYGMNGAWFAVLQGAYQKNKKAKMICEICHQCITNKGNLENHRRLKHKKITPLTNDQKNDITTKIFFVKRKQEKIPFKPLIEHPVCPFPIFCG